MDNGGYLLFIKENNKFKDNKNNEKKLLTLCGLISSTIIYVCENGLNEKVLEDLASIGNFKKQFLISEKQDDKSIDYTEYLPNLVIIAVGNEEETENIDK